MKRITSVLVIAMMTASLFAQEKMIPAQNKFRQMGTEFNTPNAYRTASGAPDSCTGNSRPITRYPLSWMMKIRRSVERRE